MEKKPANVTIERDGSTAILNLAGDWILGRTVPRFPVSEIERPGAGLERVVFRAPDIGEWDTSLLVFLQGGSEFCERTGAVMDASGLPENARSLLSLATAVPEKKDARGHQEPPGPIETLGNLAIRAAADAREMVEFAGQCTLALIGLLGGRSRMRGRDLLSVLQTTGPTALPIVGLISFLVGLIIAFLGGVILQRMAAEVYVSYLVGFGVLRELGALMTGIIMAGRTGAAFAAEIGSMKVSEEIDALRTLGISPIDFIVLPRMLALLAMMPLLTIFADIIGIYAGYLISVTTLDVTSTQFMSGIQAIVGINDFTIGIVKGALFGAIIAFTGCLRGLQCGSSADAVGVAATSAVVTSITFIIVVNALVDWISIVYSF